MRANRVELLSWLLGPAPSAATLTELLRRRVASLRTGDEKGCTMCDFLIERGAEADPALLAKIAANR
jgi:hypothetical protein